MSGSTGIRRATYVIACLAPAWAAITFINDGVAWRLGAIRLSSTEPLRPLAVGLVAAFWYAYSSGPGDRDADGAWLTSSLHMLGRAATPIIVVLGCLIGLAYGTYTAAGSDPYGYVSQAELWLHGRLLTEQPIVQQVSWPNAAWTFTPLGYRPVSDAGTIAPTYPPGLPMMMAAFQRLFGATSVFVVVPLFASVAIGATYMLGIAATRSRSVGTVSALLLLASPAFLIHTLMPMTDVPATAGWALVCVYALREPAPRPLLSGLAAGVSVLIRPNLILLATAPIVGWLFAPKDSPHAWRATGRRVATFVAVLLPGPLVFATLNYLVYGSPFESGYGSLGDNYNTSATAQNVRNYLGWMRETQTSLVALLFVPFVIRRALRQPTTDSSPRACLASLLVLVALSYAFYHPFDNWTYLRFLLPAYPAMFVLMTAAVWVLCRRLPTVLKPAAVILFVVIALSTSLEFAKDARILHLRDQEQRYVRAAQRVAQTTPAGAVMFALEHSGSLRYHADRMTLRYDLLPPTHLDSAIHELRARGKPAYLVIDEPEREAFRSRFAGSRAGGLVDGPVARVAGPPDVLIFELKDPVE